MNRKRNGKFVDIWSLAHFLSGVAFSMFLPPVVALALLTAWEPFENFVLSPLLWRYFKVSFGHESLPNSLSDIVFDSLGILVGITILTLV